MERIERWLRRALDAAAEAEPAASSAAEWLLDNGHLVQRAVLQVKHDLPPGFYQRLRRLADGPATGEPLIFLLAHDLLHATHFQLSRESVIAYLDGYQEHNPLTIAELWALPAMLRIACLERVISGFEALFPDVRAPLASSASCAMYISETEPTECVSRSIANLRVVSSIIWKDVFDATSLVERKLAEAPAGVYQAMEFETRDAYRRAVERLASRCGKDELAVANCSVALARASESPAGKHVGYWLVGDGLARLEHEVGARPPPWIRLARLLRKHPGAVHASSLFLLGLAGLSVPAAYLDFSGATLLQWILGIGLSALPATVISVTMINWLVTLIMSPTRLPKLDFSDGIASDWPTLVAMPVIVRDVEEVASLVDRLEAHFLANPSARNFVLLSDPADASQERVKGDEDIERALKDGISSLNRRHGRDARRGPFCLLHRPRRFNPAQGCWMAWERKRGKLEEFNHFLLTGKGDAFTLKAGPVSRLPGTRFVVTADADTRLPPGTVARLAGTLAHPLNRPVFDATGRVVAGYTVLQPRVEIAPHGSDSLFARLFGGDTAIDIYSRAVSDVYQDLFGSGNYVGKGLYDVAAFNRSLQGRVPENNLLSHDLWEGLHGRTGLVTDIIVYESFPESYSEYVRRWHRWIRGDWQLLPWLWPTVPGAKETRLKNRLTFFDRLRLWDNMRRSLVPPSVLLLMLGGWFLLPGNPLIWTVLALLAPSAYLFTDIVTGVARGRRRGVLVGTFRRAWEHVGRWAMSVAFLVSDSAVALHAIGTTLLRLRLRRHLLDWTSAEHVSRELRKSHPRVVQWRRMWISPIASVVLTILLAATRPDSLPVAAPLLLLWFVAPELAWLVGRPRHRKIQQLDDEAREFLRLVARRSWLFFEDHVRPEDNWLPPDNHQEEPVEATAHRTSPTNIGMMMLSALAAWRLGHIGTDELSVRMREALHTLDRLERWRGHLLNWYDTVSLTPLEPRYVSTVDSGNLAVSLATLAEGCKEICLCPVFDRKRWQGLEDCLGLLGGALEVVGLPGVANAGIAIEQLRTEIRISSTDPRKWPELLDNSKARCASVKQDVIASLDGSGALSAERLRDLRNWLERSEHHLEAMRREIDASLPWLKKLANAPPECSAITAALVEQLSADRPQGLWEDVTREAQEALEKVKVEVSSSQAVEWFNEFLSDIKRGLAHSRDVASGLLAIAKRANDLAEAMDFSPLYDRNERLFFIGYDVSDNRIDQHHYDLLASEARLASFFAIAKHDAPPEHWFQLGRPIVKEHRELALVSWNGSMFEYLMPALFLRSDPKTLLDESNRSSVDIQRRFGNGKGVPWGISESGFASVGPDGAWRYRAFGVPELGLRRGLAEDLVISPYASALALAVVPLDATANLRRIAGIGGLGRCGFYEALDYTAERLPEGQSFALVKSYMAHHQGMSIAAIANALFGNLFVRWFHADARAQTVDLLLHERIPWELPPEIERLEPVTGPARRSATAPRPQAWTPQGEERGEALHLLGNGRLANRITADGSGELHWLGQALTRPGEVQGGIGQFIYLRDPASGATWSATPSPIGSGERSRTVFHAHKVEYRGRANGISSALEIMIASAEDVEIRRLRLFNGSSRKRTLEVASHAEVALAAPQEWMRHPAFARLFVSAETHPELNALLFERRARGPGDPTPVMVQRLVQHEAEARLAGWEVSRPATWRRYGDAHEFPLFSGPPGDRARYPLDPASAFLVEVTLPPRGEVELAFVTCVAAAREDALELARRYGSLGSFDWAEQDAAARSARELQGFGFPPNRLAEAQLLFSALHVRAGPKPGTHDKFSRDDLWAIGLSGDLPILLVEVGDELDLAELRFLLAAHRLWRWRGSQVDLVLLHPGMAGYVEPMRERLIELLRDAGSQDLLAERGGVHIFGREQMEPARLGALRTATAVRLFDRDGPISTQLARQKSTPAISTAFVTTGRVGSVPEAASPPAEELILANGFGGFTRNGGYVITPAPGGTTPAPWANLLANAEFGSIVTEAGLGCSFAANSGENRLTPWHNDPLSDPQGEALYLRDEENAAIWTVTPLPAGNGACRVEHRCGETVWRRESEGLVQEMSCVVAGADPVKLVRVKLTDRIGSPRRITATYFADWLLGADQGEPGPFRKSWYRADLHALLASNRWHSEFAGRTAFLAATGSPHSLTTSRREFLGASPNWERPAGLTAWDLGNRLENCGEDAAAGFQLYFDIPPGGTCEFAFILGQAQSEEKAAELIARWQDQALTAAEPAKVAQQWEERCGTLQVETPEPAFDLMVNRWLSYQTMSSRLFARAGFYQAGGAFGFRDQLQDVLALLLVDPNLARSQILRAAAHQFEEGDVQHWWHPPSGRGVRTRCSDDLLWLPFAVARYVEATGDKSLLDERVPFLHATELHEDEHDRYAEFPSASEASLYEHCLRAFDRAWRLGKHDIPLIGDGDWNDGMNRVGAGGKGESVWLGWFMAATIRSFARVSSATGRAAFSERWLTRAEELISAIERHAWDGEWYLRAFDDVGQPWGSHGSAECEIDSISQSWATIAGGGDPDRARIGLDAAFARLVRPDDQIVRLLDPPFAETSRDPGYIKSYPPGIRENGGQYSHAAAWLGIAAAMQGDGQRAKTVFDRLNPILHSDNEEKASRYLVEPYVVAADIGGTDPHLGRGGWSWYTGAAAWTWRLGVEHILGIRLIDGQIELAPCLPPGWDGFKAAIRGKGTIRISVARGSEPALIIDGETRSSVREPIDFPGDGRETHVELKVATAASGRDRQLRMAPVRTRL